MLLALFSASVAGLCLGEENLTPVQLLETFLTEDRGNPVDRLVVRDLRLPRVLCGAFIGATLAVCGTVMQAVFRNPLADPGLIGVSAGGAAGAITFIVVAPLLGLNTVSWLQQSGLTVFPMIGGILVSFIVYAISRTNGQTQVTQMLLAGLAINALVSALVGLALTASDSQQLRDFTFWSLGRLTEADATASWLTGVVTLGGLAIVARFRQQMNILLLGEAEAFHLGVDVEATRRQLIGLTAAMVGLSVSIAGMIGFVGLVTPHLCRLLFGPDHRTLVPVAALLGASLLITADTFSRTILPQTEIPVGIVTALIGAPFFLWLIATSDES